MLASDLTRPGDDLLSVVIARAELRNVATTEDELVFEKLDLLSALTEIRAEADGLEAGLIALLRRLGVSAKCCRQCPVWFEVRPSLGRTPDYCSPTCKAEARRVKT